MQKDLPNTPSPAELDCLTVLWQHDAPLQVQDIQRLVGERRRKLGEAEPSRSTISTQLRSLASKQLVTEVRVSQGASPPIRTRGMLSPAARSPLTGYTPAYKPGQVLEPTMRALASAYPPGQRGEALLDFARALDLSKKAVARLRRLIDELDDSSS